jgi:hypothetical protein
MAKRAKTAGDERGSDDVRATKLARATHPPHPPHPPKKQPVWLAVSVILFALWFVFLLVTAVFG